MGFEQPHVVKWRGIRDPRRKYQAQVKFNGRP
jgi:hypothetical protein